MTKDQIIEQRINKIVDRITRGGLKWKATVQGSNGQTYTIPECSSELEFRAALLPAITEIVDSEETP